MGSAISGIRVYREVLLEILVNGEDWRGNLVLG